MNGAEQLAVIIPNLRSVAARIDDRQLTGPTPCSAFTVAGVLGHMTGLAAAFAPMFRGERQPDDAAGSPGAVAAFDAAMADLLDAVQSDGALARNIQTPGGSMPGEVFSRMVAFDGLVHGWDLATSTGQSWDLPEELVTDVDGFARQALTPQMRDGEAWADEQRAPDGASCMQRLVAFSGRTV